MNKIILFLSIVFLFFTEKLVAQDFTVIALPDTQHYSDSSTNFQIFIDQAQWILDNRVSRNIVLVDQLGDIVDTSDATQWNRAKQALLLLNQNDIAVGIAPGNHDYNTIFSNTGPADLYDENLPATTAIATSDGLGIVSYEAHNWYGGYMGGTNDVVTTDDGVYENRLWKNNYVLFSAGGMDFINIALEYNFPFQTAQWVNDVLTAFPNRRAIISTHQFLEDDNSVSNEGAIQAVLSNILAEHCNVFLILSAHNHSGSTPGEAERDEVNTCGNPVYLRMSDYQGETNGGNGFLRIMTFHPSTNIIDVETYSPTLDQYKTDADSQFTLAYQMTSSGLDLTIDSPENNENFPSGTNSLTVMATATDNNSINRVEFLIDNVLEVTDNDNTDSTYEATILGTLADGIHTVEVIAYDNEENSTNKQITISVGPVNEVLSISISSGSDDAEEDVSTGDTNISSTDLEMVFDNSQQEVGMRFQNVNIPIGSIITNAYIEFVADATNGGSGASALFIYGQDADNPSTFTTAANNITNRTKTTASVTWNPGIWSTGTQYQTNNITTIVQEIVDRNGWVSGNAMVFIINGDSGNQVRAESYNGISASAPSLHIEYTQSKSDVYTLNLNTTLQGRTNHSGTYMVQFYDISDLTIPAYSLLNQTADAAGNISLSQTIATGSYKVLVKHPQFLQRLANVVVSANQSITITTLDGGDAVPDNVINISDFGVFSGNFGKNVGDEGYNGAADFNGDQTVNISDFGIFSGNFGKTGDDQND